MQCLDARESRRCSHVLLSGIFWNAGLGGEQVRQLGHHHAGQDDDDACEMCIRDSINAAARINGMSYSVLMNGLKKAGVQLDRKVLSDMAVNDPAAFTAITEVAKKAL